MAPPNGANITNISGTWVMVSMLQIHKAGLILTDIL